MSNHVEALLKDVIDKVESRLSDLQDQLDQSAAALAGYVGPAAAAHRLAEISLRLFRESHK